MWLYWVHVAVFWSAVCINYRHNPKSIVVGWLIWAGMSLVLNISLSTRTWLRDKDPKARKSARAQIQQWILPLVLNTGAVVFMGTQGEHSGFGGWFLNIWESFGQYDAAVSIAAVTVVLATMGWCLLTRRSLTDPWARAWYVIGMKPVAQVVYAVYWLLSSNPIFSLLALTQNEALFGQSGLRLVQNRETCRNATDTLNRARANLFTTKWDWGSAILVLGFSIVSWLWHR